MALSRILIVEDHKDFRQAVRHFLELNQVKARLTEACSGEEGVLLAKRLKPKIVIMDFYLRGMNGVEAATKIKEILPKCRVIMLTMLDPKEIAFKEHRHIIHAFVSKSDLYDQLVPAINKVLNI